MILSGRDGRDGWVVEMKTGESLPSMDGDLKDVINRLFKKFV